MTRNTIKIELMPHERDAILKWNFTDEVRSQLMSSKSGDDIVTIRIPRYLLGWVISDLNHAIVKRGCQDDDVIELSQRLEYIEETGDGRLDIDGW